MISKIRNFFFPQQFFNVGDWVMVRDDLKQMKKYGNNYAYYKAKGKIGRINRIDTFGDIYIEGMENIYFSRQMLFHTEKPKPYVIPKGFFIPSKKIRLTDEQIKSFGNILK